MRRLILAGGVAALLAVPAAAHALGTATLSGEEFSDGYGYWDFDSVHIVASGDASDDITFAFDGETLTARDPGVPIAGAVDDSWVPFAGGGPVCADSSGVRGCTTAPLVCTSGLGEASCSVTSPNTAAHPELATVTADGGPGDDRIVIPQFPDSSNNTAQGGPGDDDLTAAFVDGGPGADSLNGFVLYDDAPAPVSVTDDGVADDGALGEHDNVAPGDTVEGSPFGDRIILTGAGGAYGEAGDDVLTTHDGTARGGPGNDSITVTGTGTAMGDSYDITSGDDTIDVRNGVRNLVDCGPGDDTVIADALDDTTYYHDCEHVTVG